MWYFLRIFLRGLACGFYQGCNGIPNTALLGRLLALHRCQLAGQGLAGLGKSQLNGLEPRMGRLLIRVQFISCRLLPGCSSRVLNSTCVVLGDEMLQPIDQLGQRSLDVCLTLAKVRLKCVETSCARLLMRAQLVPCRLLPGCSGTRVLKSTCVVLDDEMLHAIRHLGQRICVVCIA